MLGNKTIEKNDTDDKMREYKSHNTFFMGKKDGQSKSNLNESNSVSSGLPKDVVV